jgi:hypothetical protein
MRPVLGLTFLPPHDQDSVPVHLYSVVSDPDQSYEEVVIANFTTYRSGNGDPSCLIQPGEHSWVRRETCVAYGHARIAAGADLEAGLTGGVLSARELLSDELIERIQVGAFESRHSPEGCLRVLRAQGFGP